MSTHWHASRIGMLHHLKARKKSDDFIASRLGCTVAELREQWAIEVLAMTEAAEKKKEVIDEGIRLQSPEHQAAIRARLNSLQIAFLDLCSAYQATGQMIELFSTMVSGTLSVDELAPIIEKGLAERRKADETTAEKLARYLTQQCIVIPNASVPQLNEQEDPNASQQSAMQEKSM